MKAVKSPQTSFSAAARKAMSDIPKRPRYADIKDPKPVATPKKKGWLSGLFNP